MDFCFRQHMAGSFEVFQQLTFLVRTLAYERHFTTFTFSFLGTLVPFAPLPKEWSEWEQVISLAQYQTFSVKDLPFVSFRN